MLGPGDEYSLGCIDTEEYSWKRRERIWIGDYNHLEVFVGTGAKLQEFILSILKAGHII